MNDLPRTVLRDLVSRFGNSLATDPLRTEGLLRDICGNCSPEIFVLVNAVRQRVPADLLAPRHSLPLSLLEEFLAKRLEDELSFSHEASIWAVRSWVEALGVSDGSPEKATGERDPGTYPSAPACDPAVAGQRQQWAGELGSVHLGNRIAAVTALSSLGDAESLRLLVGALENGNWEVRNAAFDALADHDGTAIPVLVEALADAGKEVVWRVCLILGSLQSREAVEALITTLEQEGIVRECAVWSLGEIGDTRAITTLMKCLGSDDPVLIREAGTALEKIGKKGSVETR